MAQEQQDQREVFGARTNSNSVVANVICVSDSGEPIKVTLWGAHVADYYEMFQPGHVGFRTFHLFIRKLCMSVLADDL